jgi:murein DD-endopeptidase MepM/ murein hydrolase activator NlpD
MFVRPSVGPISRAGAYGLRQLPNEPVTRHSGIDFVGATGSPIRAVRSGVVVAAAPNGTFKRYGNVVVIKHDDPSTAPFSLYAHLNAIKVRKGQRVLPGQIIGTMGSTDTEHTHLHFEMLKRFPLPPPDEDRADPTPLLATAYTARGGGRVPVLYPPTQQQSAQAQGVQTRPGYLFPENASRLSGLPGEPGSYPERSLKVLWVLGFAALAWALLPHGGQESW